MQEAVNWIEKLGPTGLLAMIIVAVTWDRERQVRRAQAAEAALVTAKTEAAKDMIAFIKAGQEAGVIRSNRSMTPTGTTTQK